MIKSYKDKAVTGVYWLGLMSVANIIVNLLIIMIISRLLTSYELGTVAALMIVISFAEIFWTLGIGPAIVQKKVLSYEDKQTASALNIIVGVFVYTIIFVFAPQIVATLGIENILMLRVLAIVCVIHSFSSMSQAILQREMRFKHIGIIQSIDLLVYGLSVIIFAILDYGAWSLVFAQLIQITTRTILYLSIRPIQLSIRIHKQSAQDLMYYGMGFTLSSFFSNIANQGDYFIVNRSLGSSALGYYNRAYQLLSVPSTVIGSVLDRILFPLLSKFQDKSEKLKYVYLNITSLISLIAFPIMIISILMGDDIVHVLLGINWDAAILPFKILIVSLVFRMSIQVCSTIMKSIGAIYKRLWIQIMYATTVVVGACIGKEWGINGVAISTTIAITINYITLVLLVNHLIKVRIIQLLRNLVPIVILSGVIAGLSLLVSLILLDTFTAFFRLLIMTLTVGLMYLVAFKYILIKLMPSDFKEFVTTILETTLSRILPMSRKKVYLAKSKK